MDNEIINKVSLLSIESQQKIDSEIDLMDVFSIIWKGKLWIIGTVFVFSLASVLYALSLSDEYKATAVVKPVEGERGGALASLASQFGGLASLAGVDLGSGGTSDSIVAMEILKSWEFAENFIKKHNLEVPIFAAKGWDRSNNKLILDDELYDEASKRWVRIPPSGKTVEPTSWELYEEFKKRLSISVDKESGFIRISLTYYKPSYAKKWVDLLISDINTFMRNKALDEANKSIKYLEENITQTNIAEIRSVFSQLIQEQHKAKMLAQVSDEYVLKTISVAKIPEEKNKPKRALIVILSMFLGLMLSILFILFKSYFIKVEK